MATPQELDQDGMGVEHDTSQGEVASTAQDNQARQPEKVDLSKLEEFKAWQASADRRVAMAEQAAQQAAMRAAELERQYHEQQMRQLDGEDKVLYQNQLLQRQLAEIQRQRDLDAYAIQRQRDLEEIVRETGVPMEQIQGLPNVHEAWAVGNRFLKEQTKRQTSETPYRQPNDNVDIGGGKPMGKAAALQAEYDEARKSYNLRAQLEVMAKADGQNIKIKEW